MRLNRLAVTDYRNLSAAVLEPAPQLTVLCGANGQGKTNLLEAVWLLTGGKSFRGAKDAELIRRGADFAVLEAAFEAGDRPQEIRLTVGAKGTQRPGRTVRLNGADRGRAASIAGTFTAVAFDPNHLSLVKGGPEGRRHFLDAALCQLYPGYLAAERRYLRVVAQKNALLKAYDITPGGDVLLETYNEALVTYGCEVMRRRAGYLDQLAPAADQRKAGGMVEQTRKRRRGYFSQRESGHGIRHNSLFPENLRRRQLHGKQAGLGVGSLF